MDEVKVLQEQVLINLEMRFVLFLSSKIENVYIKL